jgi:hypothetical protein
LRHALALFIALVAPNVESAELLLLPESARYCAKVDGYCYEWKFARDNSLRLVAQGFEDGGEWAIYRRSIRGKYRMLFSFYPAMIDARYPGKLLWGYAWDVQDVVLGTNGTGVVLQAEFDHEYEYDGNWEPPKWQPNVPFLLLRGTTTQPEMLVTEVVRPMPMTPEEIRRRATASRPMKLPHTASPSHLSGTEK